ncbi:MAG TPA: hypothetical protein VHG08_03910 [Longimicrobium sp.]|nr:hypothetical protein [Longimicrobium sp.]
MKSTATAQRRAPAVLDAAGVPALPWIGRAEGAPYFVREGGEAWTPVGYNDSLAWPELAPLTRRRDVEGVDRHLAWLAAHGVTVIRLMLECAHQGRWLERPTGSFNRVTVRFWDDLFVLCARHGLRLLLTPYDTFWTWKRWKHHPLNRANGGPCARRGRLLLCADTRQAVKERMSFAVERWGGSGVVFAWDLWNEIHPAHAADLDDCARVMDEFIDDVGGHVRALETRLYGRTHLQTVSLFGPELQWKPHLGLEQPIFRHPALDFATTHLYMKGTIDAPRDTVAPARDVGRLVRAALAEITDGRPYLDSEHGPIHTFKDHRRTLPEPFDDEYFRHMQWAHLASGGAGGGMRWPNRHPHVLTPGMRRAQRAMADFLPLVDWLRFRRRNLNGEVRIEGAPAVACACGDADQAVVWLARTDTIGRDGMLRRDAPPVRVDLRVPGLAPGARQVVTWDTARGVELARRTELADDGGLEIRGVELATDLALAIRRE